MDRKAGYPNKTLTIKQLCKTLSCQFGNDGIRDKKAGLRNAETSSDRNEVSGSYVDRDEVAGGEGGGESRSVAVGAEEVRIDAVTGAQTEHHTLEHDLLFGQIIDLDVADNVYVLDRTAYVVCEAYYNTDVGAGEAAGLLLLQ